MDLLISGLKVRVLHDPPQKPRPGRGSSLGCSFTFGVFKQPCVRVVCRLRGVPSGGTETGRQKHRQLHEGLLPLAEWPAVVVLTVLGRPRFRRSQWQPSGGWAPSALPLGSDEHHFCDAESAGVVKHHLERRQPRHPINIQCWSGPPRASSNPHSMRVTRCRGYQSSCAAVSAGLDEGTEAAHQARAKPKARGERQPPGRCSASRELRGDNSTSER